MNFEFFVAYRLYRKSNKIHKLNHINIILLITNALCMAVMIISISIVVGFKKEILDKFSFFGSYIQIVNKKSYNIYDNFSISYSEEFEKTLVNVKNVVSLRKYILKVGMVKTDNNFSGIIFKGIDNQYDTLLLQKILIDGKILKFSDFIRSNEIIISKKVADDLNLSVGDDFKSYFLQHNLRMRNFKIVGIYESGIEEIDKLFAFVDIKQLQKLNNWETNQITGFDIGITDYSKQKDVVYQMNMLIKDYNYRIKNIFEIYPTISNWISMIEINVWVILTLLFIVSGINMISMVLIIILKQLNLIGILKCLGTKDFSLQKIFIYFALFMTIEGFFIGNIFGILFCLIQKYFGIIKLPSSHYYISYIPINFDFGQIVLINIISLFVILLLVSIVVLFISKIKPAETIKLN